jgi:sugar diacid utilization regulator
MSFLAASMLLTALNRPMESEKIQACWATVHRMENEGISRDTIEAYLTRCLGAALLERCRPRPEVQACLQTG